MAEASSRPPLPGDPPGSPTRAAAERLWRGALEPPVGSRDVSEAAERLCHRLRIGMGRWLGVEGYSALLDRALTAARQDHAVLAGWPCLGADPAVAQGALKAHGAESVAAGMVALVTALADLLGNIMGKEMAVHLVEQAGRTGPHGSGQDVPGDGPHG